MNKQKRTCKADTKPRKIGYHDGHQKRIVKFWEVEMKKTSSFIMLSSK